MSNRNNLIKWMGILTMLIDHIGLYLFPQVVFLRIIGRIAFPCFVYTTVHGVLHTRDSKQYAKRMVWMGVAALFARGAIVPLNIGFTLAIIILGLTAYRQNDQQTFVLYGILSLFVEYGLYGYVLAYVIYAWQTGQWSQRQTFERYVLVHLLMLLVNPVQAYAIMGVMVWLFVQYVDEMGYQAPRMTKQFGYAFYPMHIFVLRIIGGF